MSDLSAFLALMAAVAAGTSDFVGGLASRRAPAVIVTAASQLAGFGFAVGLALVVRGDPTEADLGWGALAGVGMALGLLSIYAGYAAASVTIVAPVAGVGTAVIPVVFDVVGGDELSGQTMVGIVLGLVAIALVSLQGSVRSVPPGRSVLYGLGGAVGLGFLLICLGQTSDDGGVWPVVPARFVAFAVLAGVILSTGASRRLPSVVRPHVLAIGVLGTAANALFVGATQLGSISSAAVLNSMFPAVTVLWARFVLKEHLRVVQVIGLGLALVAIGLIAGG